MAIARDTNAAFSTTTLAYTSAGINRFLLLSIETFNNGLAPTVSTATYAGNSMTNLGSLLCDSGSQVYITLFGYLIPASVTGSNNIVINATGNWLGYAASYTGVKSFNTATTTTNTAATSLSLSLTSLNSTSWGIGAWYNSTSGSAHTNASYVVGSSNSIWDTNGGQTAGAFSMAVTPSNASGSPANGAIAIVMSNQDRFWVGGTGNWDATTTHWSDATGGSNGASVPVSTDNVIFDSSSGAGTSTLTVDTNVATANLSGYTGTLALSTHTLTLAGSGTVWNGGGTISPGTSTIKLTDATSTAKTFAGANLIYYNFQITGSGTGTYTITGSNQFNNFTIDTPPHTVMFQAGSTQTHLNNFAATGSAGNLITLKSTSNGFQWFLRKSTAGTVSCDYLSLQDSNVETL